jgi:phosphoglycolate phosphatase
MPLLAPPTVILFDWHGTLADTYDAMYNALDDAFHRMAAMGLFNRLMDPARSKTPEDAKLVCYVREHQQLHPKIKAAKKVSRTDIFEVLFGPDAETKHIAHELYSECYGDHYGEVYPFEKDGRACLLEFKGFGIRLGIVTNRNRDFLEHELRLIEGGQWVGLFDVVACGDDTARRKPAPDVLARALEELGVTPDPGIWYVGDSTTDTISAKEHGITSVFFNGAHWDQAWLDKIFPGTPEHPHKPDVVVEWLRDLVDLARSCLNR